VAVKVQHRWVSALVESDVTAMDWAARALELGFPGLDLRWLTASWRSSLAAELDFSRECGNAARCAVNFSHDPIVKVPVPAPFLLGPRAFAMEFVAGARVDDKEALRAMGLDPAAVAGEESSGGELLGLFIRGTRRGPRRGPR